MKQGVVILALALGAFLTGCGGGGGGGGTSGGPPPSQAIGVLQSTAADSPTTVVMSPPPPAPTVATPAAGITPTVVVFQTTPFNASINDTTGDFTTTTQVVHGLVSGVDLSTVQLEVFSETTAFFVQPFAPHVFVNINSDGTFVCPAAPGQVHAILFNNNGFAFTLPATFSNLPPVDGTNVLAEF